MLVRVIRCIVLLAWVLMHSPSGPAAVTDDNGVVRTKSGYSTPETTLKKDVANKDISDLVRLAPHRMGVSLCKSLVSAWPQS
jgi:hypothetical protein